MCYILIYRDIKNHWIWDDKPFDKSRAWIDLIMSANYNGVKVMLGNEIVEVKRGEFITSQKKLKNLWGWSISKIRSFLEMLEKDNMIVLKKDSKKTAIEIVNYDDYQIPQIANESEKDCKKIAFRLEKETNNTKELKEIKEKNISLVQKDILNSLQRENFNLFWAMYPNKKARGDAERGWLKINPNEELMNNIIRGVERYINFDKRYKEGYISLPATWLNKKEWENIYDENENISNSTKVILNTRRNNEQESIR